MLQEFPENGEIAEEVDIILPDDGENEGYEEIKTRKIASPPDFYENLAEKLSDRELSKIASKLIEDIEEDLASRSVWESNQTLSYKYLGFVVEEYKQHGDFKGCASFDSTMASVLLSFYATAKAELFPAAGPSRSQSIGTPNNETDQQCERVKLWMNYYLTILDEAYYPDSERLLMYVGFYGSAFRKVYQDPVTKRPTARLIKPQDFIVNTNCNSLMESSRLTHVRYLSKKEILLNQMSGNFIEYKINKDSESDDELESPIANSIKETEGLNEIDGQNTQYKFYETHADLTDEMAGLEDSSKDDDYNLPRPYVVTIDTVTKIVVDIRRNWEEGDETYSRINCFVNYYYLPGFGIYGNGIGTIMGSDAIALTTAIRQTVDSLEFHNFPGGVKTKDLTAEDPDIGLAPGEFRSIETNGEPIGNCMMAMPYNEPSQVGLALIEMIQKGNLAKAASAETQIPDIGSNAPNGTAIAILELQNRTQSTILQSLHNSLAIELRLLFKLFGKYLPEEPYPFSVPGKDTAIMRRDFNDRVNIIPVSDPNAITSVHRIMQNQALLQLAQSAPQLHDMREILHRMYSSMKVDNIDAILPPEKKPVALDPTSENMLLLSGKKVVAAMFQDDEAHIISHEDFPNTPIMQSLLQTNPQAYAQILTEVTLHTKSHEANQVFKQMQQQMQQQGMPPMQLSPEQEEQIPLMPEVQNQMAINAANKIMEQRQKMEEQQQAANASQIDPNRVMLYEIEQRAEQAKMQAELDIQKIDMQSTIDREIAVMKENEAKLKAETEAFKARLKFESEKARMETQVLIAQERNEVDVAIEHSKQQAASSSKERDIQVNEIANQQERLEKNHAES